MAVRIQMRRGAATSWNATDPVLAEGEFGFDTTAGQLKIGTGTTSWSNLDYLISDASLGTSLGDYIELVEKGSTNGVAELDSDRNLLIPNASIIFEGSTENDFETTLTVTDPTADRTITFKDESGTVAFTADVTTHTNLTEAHGATGAVVGTTNTQTLTNKTLTSPVVNTEITTASTSFNLLNTVATTINFGGAADVISLGSATSTVTVNKHLVVTGDLTVNGTTTTINSTTLSVDDKNIVLADGNTSDVVADGGGITLKGASDKTFTWADSNDSWSSSEHISLASGKTYKINGTDITAALPALTWGEVKNGKSGLAIS